MAGKAGKGGSGKGGGGGKKSGGAGAKVGKKEAIQAEQAKKRTEVSERHDCGDDGKEEFLPLHAA